MSFSSLLFFIVSVYTYYCTTLGFWSVLNNHLWERKAIIFHIDSLVEVTAPSRPYTCKFSNPINTLLCLSVVHYVKATFLVYKKILKHSILLLLNTFCFQKGDFCPRKESPCWVPALLFSSVFWKQLDQSLRCDSL